MSASNKVGIVPIPDLMTSQTNKNQEPQANPYSFLAVGFMDQKGQKKVTLSFLSLLTAGGKCVPLTEVFRSV